MSRFYSYINSAKEILITYKGEEPFASFIKKHFSQHKKYGSKDRRQISHLCYCYFRLGKAAIDLPIEERILAGLFLCSDQPSEILETLKPEWNENVTLPIKEKLVISNYSFLINGVFPWKEELSDGIDYEKFSESFLAQPDLFLRLRPGKEKKVKQKLTEAGIMFHEQSSECLSFSNGTKLDDIIEADEEAVVQDYNSQQTGYFLLNHKPQTINHKLKIWDCCAASGGKSIMLFDLFKNIELTVSDVRESILFNLKKRFTKAGLINYKSLAADIAAPGYKPPNEEFDMVLADVPCSGSGTWSRTPEQLFYFEKKKIESYASLQKKIISNAHKSIRPGGLLLYITCSVFKKENEDMVGFITSSLPLQLIKMEILKGYSIKADSMFVALFQKPL